MTVKGSIVGCGRWRDAVVAELRRLGFDRSPDPYGLLSPGFFWYDKRGYIVQIKPGNVLAITRLGGRVTEKRVPDITDACLLLVNDRFCAAASITP